MPEILRPRAFHCGVSLFLGVLLPSVLGCSRVAGEPEIEQRIKVLEEEVLRAREASPEAVKGYSPQIEGSIQDLGTQASTILRQLPGVSDVEVVPASSPPTHRVIHLRDWHYVPRDLFDLDTPQPNSRASKRERNALHRAFLLEVELVQLEQATLLRCLVKHHGLRRVLVEGITSEGLPAFRDIIGSLREMDLRLADLRKEHATVRGYG